MSGKVSAAKKFDGDTNSADSCAIKFTNARHKIRENDIFAKVFSPNMMHCRQSANVVLNGPP